MQSEPPQNNFQIGSKTAKRVKIALADLGTDKKRRGRCAA